MKCVNRVYIILKDEEIGLELNGKSYINCAMRRKLDTIYNGIELILIRAGFITSKTLVERDDAYLTYKKSMSFTRALALKRELENFFEVYQFWYDADDTNLYYDEPSVTIGIKRKWCEYENFNNLATKSLA